MPSSSLHQHAVGLGAPHAAYAPHATSIGRREARRLRFGFPRAYVARMLQREIAGQLRIDSEACRIGLRDENGCFRALEDDDDFDGPDFTLRLTQAIGAHPVFNHDIDVDIGVLLGRYTLAVRGQRFDIAFLPVLDEAMLGAAVRWIIRNLDTATLAY